MPVSVIQNGEAALRLIIFRSIIALSVSDNKNGRVRTISSVFINTDASRSGRIHIIVNFTTFDIVLDLRQGFRQSKSKIITHDLVNSI